MKLGTIVSRRYILMERTLAADNLGSSGIKDTENAFHLYRSNL
jgi:hypothetical protein